MKEEKPSIFGRGGLVDRILLAANLIPEGIRDDMIRHSAATAETRILMDSLKMNIEGPGITEEDADRYKKSVLAVAERALHNQDDVVERNITRRIEEDHNDFVEDLARKQRSAVFYQQSGIQPTPLPDPRAAEMERKRRKARKEAEAKAAEVRAREENRKKPWYKREW